MTCLVQVDACHSTHHFRLDIGPVGGLADEGPAVAVAGSIRLRYTAGR